MELRANTAFFAARSGAPELRATKLSTIRPHANPLSSDSVVGKVRQRSPRSRKSPNSSLDGLRDSPRIGAFSSNPAGYRETEPSARVRGGNDLRLSTEDSGPVGLEDGIHAAHRELRWLKSIEILSPGISGAAIRA